MIYNLPAVPNVCFGDVSALHLFPKDSFLINVDLKTAAREKVSQLSLNADRICFVYSKEWNDLLRPYTDEVEQRLFNILVSILVQHGRMSSMDAAKYVRACTNYRMFKHCQLE